MQHTIQGALDSDVDDVHQPWVGELARRWGGARRAALRTIVPEVPAGATEDELLDAATAEDREAVLRRVFDNSHTLGIGFRRFHRVDLTLTDLSRLLPLLGAPCPASGLERDPRARESRSARLSCAAPRCDYWREALHGLVSGLSTSVYYSRVKSPAAGDPDCVDLLHVDARSEARLQPVSEAMRASLAPVIDSVARVSPGSTVELLGLAEGALYVQLHRVDATCGLDLFPFLRHGVERAIPGLEVRDAGPRSVLDPNPKRQEP